MIFETVLNVYSQVAESAALYGHSDIAEKMKNAAREQAQALVECESPSGKAIAELAGVYKAQNNQRKNEAVWRAVIRFYIRAFGKDDARLLAPMEQLIESYQIQGKYKEADYYLKKVLMLYENSMPDDYARLAFRMREAADFYLLWGRQKKARALIRRASRLEAAACVKSLAI